MSLLNIGVGIFTSSVELLFFFCSSSKGISCILRCTISMIDDTDSFRSPERSLVRMMYDCIFSRKGVDLGRSVACSTSPEFLSSLQPCVKTDEHRLELKNDGVVSSCDYASMTEHAC